MWAWTAQTAAAGPPAVNSAAGNQSGRTGAGAPGQGTGSPVKTSNRASSPSPAWVVWARSQAAPAS